MKKLLLVVSLTVFSFSNATAVTLYDAFKSDLSKQYSIKCLKEKILKLQKKMLIFQKLITNLQLP
jgi:hypothetical protein